MPRGRSMLFKTGRDMMEPGISDSRDHFSTCLRKSAIVQLWVRVFQMDFFMFSFLIEQSGWVPAFKKWCQKVLFWATEAHENAHFPLLTRWSAVPSYFPQKLWEKTGCFFLQCSAARKNMGTVLQYNVMRKSPKEALLFGCRCRGKPSIRITLTCLESKLCPCVEGRVHGLRLYP